VAPFLGLLGGFVSGSDTSSTGVLTALHLGMVGRIGADRLLVTSAISPAKLQNASAAIDRISEEVHVIRHTFLAVMTSTAVCAELTATWAF
jgi:lactate permease